MSRNFELEVNSENYDFQLAGIISRKRLDQYREQVFLPFVKKKNDRKEKLLGS